MSSLAHARRDLASYPSSYALLSQEAATDTALVFVHGFGGGSVASWLRFQELIDRPEVAHRFKTADVYFYHYDSTGPSVPSASDAFGRFLDDIFPQPSAAIFEVPSHLRTILNLEPSRALPRKGPFMYRSLTLVGHSTGAVILRHRVLRILEHVIRRSAEEVAAEPILKAALVLFAPAHSGFKQHALVAAVSEFGGFAAAAVALGLLAKGGIYLDIQVGSPVLQDLKEKTQAYANAYPEASVLRARILWGEDEKVVMRGEYWTDHPYVSISGRGHRDVCKPTDDFLKPLEFVADALQT